MALDNVAPFDSFVEVDGFGRHMQTTLFRNGPEKKCQVIRLQKCIQREGHDIQKSDRARANERRKLDNENVRFYEMKTARTFYRTIHLRSYEIFLHGKFYVESYIFASHGEKIYVNKLHVRLCKC